VAKPLETKAASNISGAKTRDFIYFPQR